MSAFILAKRRKRSTFSFGSKPLTTAPTESLPSESPGHESSKPASKQNLFSDDRSDDEDDASATKKYTRTRRLVTSVSSVSEGVVTLSANEKSSSPHLSSQGPRSGTLSRNSVARTHQSSTDKPSQIGRMLEKRREATQMMMSLSNPAPSPPLAHDNSSPEIDSETKFSQGRSSDEALFRVQLEQCAEDARADAYDAMPVSGFGEAMLRAMGWTGPSHELATASVDKGSSPAFSDLPKPRPDRLGLGAKLTSGALPPPSSRKRKRVVLLKQNTHINRKPPRHPVTPPHTSGTPRTSNDNSNFKTEKYVSDNWTAPPLNQNGDFSRQVDEIYETSGTASHYQATVNNKDGRE